MLFPASLAEEVVTLDRETIEMTLPVDGLFSHIFQPHKAVVCLSSLHAL